ncbi:MAG: hypothetical protein HY905_01770 [Deltaproteobacteria bacterium]|nr:hypothetical protein [Deltaproteobacteria bacterium]
MARRSVRMAVLAAAWAIAPGCGDDDAAGDDAGLDAVAETEAEGDAGPDGPDDAAGGDAEDAGDGADAGEDAAPEDATAEEGGEEGDGSYVPTPESVDLEAVAPLPSGEVILYNDWAPTPNAVCALRPDGTFLGDVVHIARAWSLGASADGSRLAIGGAQWDEGTHWGVPSLGDAIQYTWLYDASTEEFTLLGGGNVNDDCHAFTPDGAAVLVCRRWDFRLEGTSYVWEGYRAARLDLATGAAELLGDPDVQALSPAISPADGRLFYTFYEFTGSPHYEVRARDLGTGAEELIRDRARSWSFSRDGARGVFQDLADGSRLHVMGVDGAGEVTVTATAGQGGSFSPDGTRVVFLYPETTVCSHIEIVHADGSDAAAPLRIRDCGDADESITRAVWIARP